MQDFTDSSSPHLGLEYENKYSVTKEKKKSSFISIFVVTCSSVIYFIWYGILKSHFFIANTKYIIVFLEFSIRLNSYKPLQDLYVISYITWNSIQKNQGIKKS